MSCSTGLAPLLLAPTLLAQDETPEKPPEKKITNEQLAKLAKEVIPLLEREAGVRFTKTPTVRIATRTELGEGIETASLPI